MIRTLTSWSASPRGKWIVLLVWLVAAGLISPLTPTLSDISENDPLSFLPDNAESTRAARLARERYAVAGTPAIIVFRNPDGLTDADMAAAQQVYDRIAAMQEEPESNVGAIVSIFNIPQARSELLSPDNTTMTMVVTITGSAAEEPYSDRIKAIREVTSELEQESLQIRVSGPGGLLTDLVSVFRQIDLFLLLVTAGLVLFLLILIYRSPVISIVPLLIIGFVFQLSGGIAAAILKALDTPVSGEATGIMTVILFGAGTDYYLFIASRYREELARHQDKHKAMQVAIGAVSEAILSAGGTLIAASLLLLFADLGSYRSLGPVVALAVAVMLLAALTLVPAVLAILGRAGFWPFSPKYDPQVAEAAPSRLWHRIAHFVLGRPVPVLVTTLAVLVLMIGGMALFRPSYDPLESLPGDVESVEGFMALREAFPPGDLAPTSVYVEFPSGTEAVDAPALSAIGAISEAIAARSDVASVRSPAYPFGVGADFGPDQVLAALESAANPEGGAGGEQAGQAQALARAVDEFLSTDRSVAKIEVVLNENPYGDEAMDSVEEIRRVSREAVADSEVQPVAILTAGDTAENLDTRDGNNRDSRVVLPAILIAIMLILALLLRSLIAPIYLGLTIVLTYFSTLGLCIILFRVIFGHESIGSTIPFLLFVFLNALGVDYSIYLMTRLREEAAQRPLREATEHALERTGGVITSAGIILAGTFAALTTLPLRDLLQLGFAVAAGVLIDTFVTRTILVPTIVQLLGRWNWWPSRDLTARG